MGVLCHSPLRIHRANFLQMRIFRVSSTLKLGRKDIQGISHMAETNGKENLEMAMRSLAQGQASLVQSQSSLVQTQSSLAQSLASFLARAAETDARIAENERAHALQMAEIEREHAKNMAAINERFAHVDERFGRIETILLVHNRILQTLSDAIRDKIGFKPAQ